MMVVEGCLDAITPNPLLMARGVFVALLGVLVLGAECNSSRVLARFGFLGSYAMKGLFFIYIALPLIDEGWIIYRHCVLFWERSEERPCPNKDDRSVPPPREILPVRSCMHPFEHAKATASALWAPGTRLLQVVPHSRCLRVSHESWPQNWMERLVPFVIGLSLFSAGFINIVFALTVPPSPSHQRAEERAEDKAAGLDDPDYPISALEGGETERLRRGSIQGPEPAPSPASPPPPV
jgi:hypothetical protein